jgi:pSer/pThr/pTyr-binding forkhead associated (FHA) protein
MHELGRDVVMIGRAPSNQIVIDHQTVSGQHAVLLRTGDSYSLMDLNSMNGTRINGDFVTNAELKDGDTIRFGSVTAVFAGAYRKRFSSYPIRKFWMSISGKRGTADCVRDGVSVLKPGMSRSGGFKKKLVDECHSGNSL